jgi:hypothetical protein
MPGMASDPNRGRLGASIARAKREGAAVVRGGPWSSKHRNTRTLYGGRWFDSKKEARYAELLDQRVRDGQIFTWRKGVSIFLVSNGIELRMPSGRRAYYRPDFEVTHLDGRVELIDVKGRQDTAQVAFKLFWVKKEVVRAMGIEVTVV